MGSCAPTKKSNSNPVTTNKHQSKVLKKSFDRSYFSPKSSFWSTISTLFSANYLCKPLNSHLYKSFRRFIIDSALTISSSNSTLPQYSPLTAPPLVDEIWCCALQLPEAYAALCQTLVGCLIHRRPTGTISNFERLFQKHWPRYDKDFWPYDKKYTVWVFHNDFEGFLTQAYEYVYLRESLKNPQKVHEIYFHLNMVRSFLQGKRDKSLGKRVYCEPDSSNSFFGLEVSEVAEKTYESILAAIKKDLKELIDSKFCLGDLAAVYIEEYARFLTLVYLQPGLATPSHEIELIWRLHFSLSLEYSEFCQSVFGGPLEFVSVHEKAQKKINVVKGYSLTKELYVAIFKQEPLRVVWPDVEDWKIFSNFHGSWISLLRLIESMQKVIELYKSKEINKDAVMAVYCFWGQKLENKEILEIVNDKKVGKVEREEKSWGDEEIEPKLTEWKRIVSVESKRGNEKSGDGEEMEFGDEGIEGRVNGRKVEEIEEEEKEVIGELHKKNSKKNREDVEIEEKYEKKESRKRGEEGKKREVKKNTRKEESPKKEEFFIEKEENSFNEIPSQEKKESHKEKSPKKLSVEKDEKSLSEISPQPKKPAHKEKSPKKPEHSKEKDESSFNEINPQPKKPPHKEKSPKKPDYSIEKDENPSNEFDPQPKKHSRKESSPSKPDAVQKLNESPDKDPKDSNIKSKTLKQKEPHNPDDNSPNNKFSKEIKTIQDSNLLDLST